LRTICIGGGPAGLFLSILLKRNDPSCEVVVLERNRPDDTFGWGVVFSDQTLDNIAAADPTTYAEIERSFVHWDDIDIHYRGRVLRAGGQGFAGIARKRLLQILQRRAASLGVALRFRHEVTDDRAYGVADVIAIADGANSTIRRHHADVFGTSLELRRNRYIWLGTHRRFDAFTFAFKETPHGWFQVHAYRFDRDLGTVIVECREETWKAAGLEDAGVEGSIAFCERLFGEYLDGS
jgi:anthraniloyl-CoA monooxygenase